MYLGAPGHTARPVGLPYLPRTLSKKPHDLAVTGLCIVTASFVKLRHCSFLFFCYCVVSSVCTLLVDLAPAFAVFIPPCS